jgi:hypothetical protein
MNLCSLRERSVRVQSQDRQELQTKSTMVYGGLVLSVVVVNIFISQIILVRAAAAGEICNCEAVPSTGKCLSLNQQDVDIDSIASGTDGLPCAERICGTRYEQSISKTFAS